MTTANTTAAPTDEAPAPKAPTPAPVAKAPTAKPQHATGSDFFNRVITLQGLTVEKSGQTEKFADEKKARAFFTKELKKTVW